jgi:hypothetical protein
MSVVNENRVRPGQKVGKESPDTSFKTKPLGLFNIVQKAIRIDSIFENGLPVRYVPRLLFVAMLCLIYIGNNHFANSTIVKINKTQAEIEELWVDYNTQKAEYMFASKQSEVARNVAPLGLIESQTPPKKIILSK